MNSTAGNTRADALRRWTAAVDRIDVETLSAEQLDILSAVFDAVTPERPTPVVRPTLTVV